ESPAADDHAGIQGTKVGPHHPVPHPDLIQGVADDSREEALLHLGKKRGVVLGLIHGFRFPDSCTLAGFPRASLAPFSPVPSLACPVSGDAWAFARATGPP